MEEPFSFRPLPSGIRKPKNLAEFIFRANAEPGGFKAMSQEELRAQIAAQRDDGSTDGDIDTSDDTDKPKTIVPKSALLVAHNKIALQASIAHERAMLLLDTVSLVLSKENPAQGLSTLSPVLRSLVGVGTLGTTLYPVPNELTRNRIRDRMLIVTGGQLLDDNRATGILHAAATRLQRENGLEAKYWDDVLAFRQSGWPVFRLPPPNYAMGVRYGFRNTSPHLGAVSIARLKRAEGGRVHLDCRKDSISKRLQVVVLEDGKVVGRSSLPQIPSEYAPLDERILEARNTAFSTELWHELVHEGRSLLVHGVKLRSGRLELRVDEHMTVRFQLVRIQDNADQAKHEYDDHAQFLSDALYILLSHAHRVNERMRSDPAAASRNRAKRVHMPYNLLMPIITHTKHEQTVRRCIHFLSQLTAVLHSAGLDDASCTITEPPLAPAPGAPSHPEGLTAALFVPGPVYFDLVITREARVKILASTHPAYGTRFLLKLLPPADAETETETADTDSRIDRPDAPVNPLVFVFPPDPDMGISDGSHWGGRPDDQYRTFDELVWYLQNAVPRAIAAKYLAVANVMRPAVPSHNTDDGGDGDGDGDDDGDDDGDEDGAGWKSVQWISSDGFKGIRNEDTEELGVQFDMALGEGDTLELQVSVDCLEKGEKGLTRHWTWAAGVESQEKLDEVVQMAVKNGSGTEGVIEID